MAELLMTSSIIAFLTLAALEIVLGIDNLVFIAILSGKLPEHQRGKAQKIGLLLAALGRIVLLFAVTWVIASAEVTLFSLPDWIVGEPGIHGDGHEVTEEALARSKAFSLKDLILVLGGLFLVGKATWEIHHKMEGAGDHPDQHVGTKKAVTFGSVIGQILALDLVFSIDSVLTAVGMVNPDEYTGAPFPGTSIPWQPLVIMSSAIILAIVVMLAFAAPLSRFIERHPTFKMLALAFLVLIGVVLIAEGFHQHISRGYIYSAMGFSLIVELLNMKAQKRRKTATAPAT